MSSSRSELQIRIEWVENAFIESFNGRLRDELLNGELFMNLLDARRKLEAWRRDYDQNRPHGSIGDPDAGRVRQPGRQGGRPYGTCVLTGEAG